MSLVPNCEIDSKINVCRVANQYRAITKIVLAHVALANTSQPIARHPTTTIRTSSMACEQQWPVHRLWLLAQPSMCSMWRPRRSRQPQTRRLKFCSVARHCWDISQHFENDTVDGAVVTGTALNIYDHHVSKHAH